MENQKIPDEESAFEQKSKHFKRSYSSFLLVTLPSTALISLMWFLYYSNCIDDIHTIAVFLNNNAEQKLICLSYYLILASMWATYFLSGLTNDATINSLRRFLMNFADFWGFTEEEKGTEYLAAIRDKSRASMTMLAMLSAGSTLLLARSLDKFEDAIKDPTETWDTIFLTLSSGGAAIALICFIIAVDSFDVLFNKFGKNDDKNYAAIVNYFYSSTRNSRYYGIMFLLWTLCFFASSYHPLLGAFVSAAVICIGWKHWFPTPFKDRKWPDPGRTLGHVLRVILFCVPVLAAFTI